MTSGIGNHQWEPQPTPSSIFARQVTVLHCWGVALESSVCQEKPGHLLRIQGELDKQMACWSTRLKPGQ